MDWTLVLHTLNQEKAPQANQSIVLMNIVLLSFFLFLCNKLSILFNISNTLAFKESYENISDVDCVWHIAEAIKPSVSRHTSVDYIENVSTQLLQSHIDIQTVQWAQCLQIVSNFQPHLSCVCSQDCDASLSVFVCHGLGATHPW